MSKDFETPGYNLFLDAFRNPLDVFDYTGDISYSTKEWVIVRNYDEFRDTITERYLNGEFPHLVSFDNDLSDEPYNHTNYQEFDYEEFKEKTGYTCAKWLIDFCVDKNLYLPEYLVYSLNSVGKSNIISLFKGFKCEYCSGEGYHKMSCYKNQY